MMISALFWIEQIVIINHNILVISVLFFVLKYRYIGRGVGFKHFVDLLAPPFVVYVWLDTQWVVQLEYYKCIYMCMCVCFYFQVRITVCRRSIHNLPFRSAQTIVVFRGGRCLLLINPNSKTLYSNFYTPYISPV